MFTKTKIALAAVLVLGGASLASAQEADPILLNRYPAYNGVVAAAPAWQPSGFQTSQVKLERRRHLRSAPVRLQEDNGFNDGFIEPTPRGGGHLPGAFYQQVQPGFPQSPPGGGS